MDNGMVLHFIHQEGDNDENWDKLMPLTEMAFEYASANFGQYPYEQFSVIQGGDGGMEYPMSTLITGRRGSLLGVTIHEAMHDWYFMEYWVATKPYTLGWTKVLHHMPQLEFLSILAE